MQTIRVTDKDVVQYSPREILDLPMQQPNDADAGTIREYLVKLLQTLWIEGEGFRSNRPFGNSYWEYELYTALVVNKAVKGQYVKYEGEEGIYDTDLGSKTEANNIIEQAIISLNET